MGQWIVELAYGAQLIVDIDASGLQATLDAQKAHAEDITPLLEAIATVMRQAFGQRFAEGGDPAWTPLAPSTIAAKSGAGLPKKTPTGRIPFRLKQNGAFGAANILIATGALRDSYRQKNAKGHVEVIDTRNGTVEVGSSLPYAGFMQNGTRAFQIRATNVGKPHSLAFTGSKGEMAFRRVVNHPGLVARPVLLTDADKAQIADMIREWFDGAEMPRQTA